MPSSTRDLTLRFIADTDQLKSATSSVKKATGTMSNSIGSAGEKGSKRFSKGIGGIGAAVGKLAGPLAALFAADKIKDFGVDAVKQASDLNETVSKSQQIFGKQADSMNKWSQNAATAFGLSQAEALAAATSFGDMFSQIGFTGKEAAKSSKDVVQMAADLGSFNNLETGDVLDRISAAMRGEYDSLQAVIPNINAARVEKEALAATGKKNAKALTAEEKAQATLAIIQKDGAKAMGDFARTSDGFANQQKIMKANFDNLKATLGQAVLPLLSKGAKILNDFLGPAIEKTKTGVKALSDWFAQSGISEWFGKIKDAVSNASGAAGGMSAAFGAVKTAFGGVMEAAKKLWSVVAPIVQQIGGKLFSEIQKNLPQIKATISDLMQGLASFLDLLGAYYTKIAGTIQKVWAVIGPTVLKILGNIVSAVVGILSGLAKVISGILNVIVGIFTGDFGRIKKGVGQILNGLVKIVKSILTMMFKNVRAVIEPMVQWAVKKISGLGKKITGTFQGMVQWIKSTFAKAWAAIQGIFVQPVQKAWKALVGFVGKIRKAIAAVAQWAASSWRKSWAKIKDFFTAPIISARKTLVSIIAKIRAALNNVKTWAASTWKKGWAKLSGYLSAPIKKGREAVSAAIDKVKSTLRGIKDWAGSTFKAGWAKIQSWIMTPVDKVKTGLSNMFGKGGHVRTLFSGFIDAVGSIFGKMKAAIGRPLNKVIDFINKGLIRGGINKILNALGVPKKDQVPWISPVSFEAGGPVTGGRPWQRAGRDRYPAYLDRDEHVLTRGEVRRLGGHRRILQWRKAVQQGKAYDYPALAAGGTVRPVPGGFGTFPSYPGHTGVDFPVGTGTPVHAVVAGVIKAVRSLTYSYGKHIIQGMPNGMESVYAHLNSFAVKQGQNVGAGQVIGYSDSTGNSTGPHLHYTLQHPGGNYVDPTSFLQSGKLPGGTAGGGITGAISDFVGFLKGLSPVKWLTNKAAGLKDGILKLVGRNPWAQGLARIPGFLIRKAGSFMQDKLFGGIMGGGEPAGSGVQRWRSTIVAALKANGLPTSNDYVEAWLRQVQSESGGNPKAVQNGYVDVNTISGDLAKGLLQTISATFNAYKHAGHGDIFNGFDNALAAINYAKNRYGSKGMLGVIGHGHGYDSGGWLPARSATLAVNKTNRPEPVLTGNQWDALTRRQRDPDPEPRYEIHLHGVYDRMSAAREIERLLGDLERSRGGVRIPARSRKVVAKP